MNAPYGTNYQPYPPPPGQPPSYPPSYPPPYPPSYPPPYPPYVANLPTRTPRPPVDRAALVQKLLLIAGALCVLGAASVFLAVSWDTIGVDGQAAVALSATAFFGAASALLARRGLQMSAEALAAVTSGLLIFDVGAAHRLDVLGAAGVPNEVFLASAHACLLLVIVGLAGAARRVQSYPLAAVALAGLVPAEVLRGLSEVGHPVPAPLRLLTAAALALLIGALVPCIAARARLAGGFAAGLSVLWALGCVVIGVRTSAADAVSGAGGVSGVLLIALGCAGLWRLAVRPAHPDAEVVERLGGVLAMIAAVGASLSAVALAGHGGDRGLTLLTIGVTCAGSGLLVCSRHRALTLGFGLGVQMGALLYGPLCSPWSSEGIAFQLSGVCLLLAAAAASWATVRQAAGALSAVSLLLAVAVGSIGRHDPLAWFAIGTAAAIAVIIGVAAMRASRTEEITLGIVALAACWIPLDAAAIAARHGQGHLLPAVLTIYGAALLVWSTAPQRSWLVQPAAIVLALAAIDLAALRHITAPEAYSMPLAAAVAITGYVMWRRNRSASSWLISGPALVIALGPSTVVSLHDTGLTRIASTLAAAVTLALAGIALRAAAPLVLGCVSAVAVAIAQLAPYAAGTPRWMTLGLAGIALLALGIGFEQARSGARAAGRWVGELR